MKIVKIAAIAVFLLVVAVLTAPMWGGCDFNETICSNWCELRHMNSELKTAACKASCAADKLSCLAK